MSQSPWHPHDFAFGLLGPGEQVGQGEVVGAAAVGQLAAEGGAQREAMVNGDGLVHICTPQMTNSARSASVCGARLPTPLPPLFDVFGAPVGVECRSEAAQRIVDILNAADTEYHRRIHGVFMPPIYLVAQLT